LSGLENFIKNKNVVDPFAGGGDLIVWAKKNGAKKVVGYDIDDKCVDNKTIFLNDSIHNPKKYDFVITNPPYLNVNKADKKTKEKYFYNFNFEDLYQISLSQLKNSKEGIIILPINFLSAENSKKIRDEFFARFYIVKMNYFKHQVFCDTTYNVIAFYYKEKKNSLNDKLSIKTTIYPERKNVLIELQAKYHWAIGGEFLEKIRNQKNILGVSRLTEKDIIKKENGKIIKIAYNHVKNRDVFSVDDNFYDLIQKILFY
jgi:16S rRNA G966 N2-methylase RsmD